MKKAREGINSFMNSSAYFRRYTKPKLVRRADTDIIEEDQVPFSTWAVITEWVDNSKDELSSKLASANE